MKKCSLMGALFALIVILTSCDYNSAELKHFDQRIKNYNTKHQLGLKPTGSGLYLKIDSLGTGRPIQIQDSIWVSYTLKLLSGKIIEVQDKPIGMQLNFLIKGWQEALFNLPVGSSLRCIIPPQLAYGQGGNEKIGQDKILYFKMKVTDAK